MKKIILFAVLIAISLVGTSNATLTATIDKNARVSLATTLTPTASAVWSKSSDGGSAWVEFASTGTGTTVTDNRPHKHYTRVLGGSKTFTFTGVEIGLIYNISTNMSITATVDGVSEFFGLTSSHTPRGTPNNRIFWAKSGLANTSHSVSITDAPFDAYKGYVYSDFSASFGAVIIYKVIVDGAVTETVSTTPYPDNRAAMQSLSDRLISGGTFTAGNLASLANLDIIEAMGAVAGMYAETDDARLPVIAEAIYAEFKSRTSGDLFYEPYYFDDGIETETYSVPQILTNGRTGRNFYYGYRAFGDSRYLAVADTVATYFKTTWPRDSNGVWSEVGVDGFTPINNILIDYYPYVPVNQRTAPVDSCILLYSEPSSSHYHDDVLLEESKTNANWALGLFPGQTHAVDQDGMMIYFPDNPIIGSNYAVADASYAMFSWAHLIHLNMLGWRPYDEYGDIMYRVNDWIANFMTYDEPLFYRSLFYWDNIPSTVFARVATRFLYDRDVPVDFVELFFSAAFDTVSDVSDGNANPDYLPEGYAASTSGLLRIPSIALFWALPELTDTGGVPSTLWRLGYIPNRSTDDRTSGFAYSSSVGNFSR